MIVNVKSIGNWIQILTSIWI